MEYLNETGQEERVDNDDWPEYYDDGIADDNKSF